VGQRYGFALEGFAQGLRHGLGIAEVAHQIFPFASANEGCQALALLTRSLGQRAPGAARYVHRTHTGRKRRVVSTQNRYDKICAPGKAAVNRGSKINL
jgi:hypothetical protein